MPKILVVDDEVNIRRVVELKLAGSGYDVVVTTNAAEGYAKALEWRPDLIISDFRMPGGMTGADLVRRLRDTIELARTPIILLTGSVAVVSDLRDILQDLGGITFVSKPFSPRELLAHVQRLIGATSSDARVNQ